MTKEKRQEIKRYRCHLYGHHKSSVLLALATWRNPVQCYLATFSIWEGTSLHTGLPLAQATSWPVFFPCACASQGPPAPKWPQWQAASGHQPQKQLKILVRRNLASINKFCKIRLENLVLYNKTYINFVWTIHQKAGGKWLSITFLIAERCSSFNQEMTYIYRIQTFQNYLFTVKRD